MKKSIVVVGMTLLCFGADVRAAAPGSPQALRFRGAPPVVVGACDGLGQPGEWQEITPPPVKAEFGLVPEYGTFAFAADPVNLGTVYVGTIRQGIWRTTDCGATWVHINTGRGAHMDGAMQWTFLIDPVEPNVLYTNSGYGASNGAFKSVNGGVDWDPIWPPADPALRDIVDYNFANVIIMDPADRHHLLLTFHAPCKAPYNSVCIAETFDAGATWRMINGAAPWDGREGQVMYFLNDSRTWLWASQSNGFWYTSDSGGTWERAFGGNAEEAHLQGSQLYRAKDGVFYVSAANGVWRSPTGVSNERVPGSWTLIPNTGPLAGGLIGNGTTMFLSRFYGRRESNIQPFRMSAETDGLTWAVFPSPPVMNHGGIFQYDKERKILYSSNLGLGLWRVVVP